MISSAINTPYKNLPSVMDNQLKQAERHYSRNNTRQAVTHVEEFVKHLNNKAHSKHVTVEAKKSLESSAQSLREL
jgi:hypothetical protein